MSVKRFSWCAVCFVFSLTVYAGKDGLPGRRPFDFLRIPTESLIGFVSSNIIPNWPAQNDDNESDQGEEPSQELNANTAPSPHEQLGSNEQDNPDQDILSADFLSWEAYKKSVNYDQLDSSPTRRECVNDYAANYMRPFDERLNTRRNSDAHEQDQSESMQRVFDSIHDISNKKKLSDSKEADMEFCKLDELYKELGFHVDLEPNEQEHQQDEEAIEVDEEVENQAANNDLVGRRGLGLARIVGEEAAEQAAANGYHNRLDGKAIRKRGLALNTAYYVNNDDTAAIAPDRSGHGSVWKRFVPATGRKWLREGSYNEKMERLRD